MKSNSENNVAYQRYKPYSKNREETREPVESNSQNKQYSGLPKNERSFYAGLPLNQYFPNIKNNKSLSTLKNNNSKSIRSLIPDINEKNQTQLVFDMTDKPPSGEDILFHSSKRSHSPQNIEVELKYECFQLIYNTLFDTIRKDFSSSNSEDLCKLYSSCLDLSTKFFKDVKPVSISPSTDCSHLEYDPDIDSPNFHDFTELEVSMLRKISCGCRSLSWNEFEKMFLITRSSETKHLKDSDSLVTEVETADENVSEENPDSINIASKRRVIHDSRLYRHNDSNCISQYLDCDLINKDSYSNKEIDSIAIDQENSEDSDPLRLYGVAVTEMIDGQGTVVYNKLAQNPEGFAVMSDEEEDRLIIADDSENESLNCPEILSIGQEETENLRERLKNFVLHSPCDLSNLQESSPENSSQPPTCELLSVVEQPDDNDEIDIQGISISTEEFCTSDLITFPQELTSSCSGQENVAIPSTSSKGCSSKPVDVMQPSQTIHVPDNASLPSFLSSFPNNAPILIINSDDNLGLQSEAQHQPISSETFSPGVIFSSEQIESSGTNQPFPLFQIVMNDENESEHSLPQNLILGSTNLSLTSESLLKK